jgi:aspartyl-tRNA synthetase
VLFIDLRDRYGITQVIFDPQDSQEAWNTAQSVKGEYSIQVSGVVLARPAEMANPRLSTGEIEIRCDEIQIFNASPTVPFPLDDEQAEKVSEELRMSYRFLDLRRVSMLRNLQLRHKMSHAVRQTFDANGFLEVETPILTKSTPEGARDYLVPNRLDYGTFYALPQAPQQYKQLLMMGGVDRYFQLARCFRDEDLRADRQPEFTQIDVEMSFVETEDLYRIIDQVLAAVVEAAGRGSVELPLPRMTYDHAITRYGVDKPDTRFGMEIEDLSDIFEATEFKVFGKVVQSGGVVKAINAKGQGAVPIRVIDEWTEEVKEAGLGGLAYIRVQEDGSWKSPIVKFFSDDEKAALESRLEMEAGDLILFAADRAALVHPVLGKLRLDAGRMAGLLDDDKLSFTWVTEFPLYEQNETGAYSVMHHPFTSPHPEDVDRMESDPLSIRAQAYDIVLNGVELGSGSIRIHDTAIQEKMFKVLGMPEEEVTDRFGHLLTALSYGAPPHGGIALGFDRLAMIMADAETIRDVIAFPKNQRGADLMMHAPSEVSPRQLRDAHIQLAGEKPAS